jgi:hypothetical protein
MTSRSRDELFQVLSNARRRYVIYYLAREGPQLGLNQLATKIAAAETGTPEADITGDERQRVYISLYQTHLPKLEEAGIVSYDDAERTVSLADDVREEGFFWMHRDDESHAWRRYYAAIAAASWLLVGGVWASVPPFSTLGWAGVAVLVTLALTTLVVAQAYTTRTTTTEQPTGYELLIE